MLIKGPGLASKFDTSVLEVYEKIFRSRISKNYTSIDDILLFNFILSNNHQNFVIVLIKEIDNSAIDKNLESVFHIDRNGRYCCMFVSDFASCEQYLDDIFNEYSSSYKHTYSVDVFDINGTTILNVSPELFEMRRGLINLFNLVDEKFSEELDYLNCEWLRVLKLCAQRLI
jgi:hypothetical protein